ncbi:MAG: hypothetical protein HQL55_13995 [Magnetococcales bacterium]|nr:hypothetical protein [Magnetococcales bacterium]
MAKASILDKRLTLTNIPRGPSVVDPIPDWLWLKKRVDSDSFKEIAMEYLKLQEMEINLSLQKNQLSKKLIERMK